jgi:hypothetical protein
MSLGLGNLGSLQERLSTTTKDKAFLEVSQFYSMVSLWEYSNLDAMSAAARKAI